MGSSQGQAIAIAVMFLVLPTAFVGLRVWAKTMSRGGLGWDDYLIFAALVLRRDLLTLKNRLQPLGYDYRVLYLSISRQVQDS